MTIQYGNILKSVAPVVQLVSSKILTLGLEFESRCRHTDWDFSKRKRPTSGERIIV